MLLLLLQANAAMRDDIYENPKGKREKEKGKNYVHSTNTHFLTL